MFSLHPSLASKIRVIEWPLCLVLLQDERHYPWVILVPKRSHVQHLLDLSEQDQLQLLKESNFVQRVL